MLELIGLAAVEHGCDEREDGGEGNEEQQDRLEDEEHDRDADTGEKTHRQRSDAVDHVNQTKEAGVTGTLQLVVEVGVLERLEVDRDRNLDDPVERMTRCELDE